MEALGLEMFEKVRDTLERTGKHGASENKWVQQRRALRALISDGSGWLCWLSDNQCISHPNR